MLAIMKIALQYSDCVIIDTLQLNIKHSTICRGMDAETQVLNCPRGLIIKYHSIDKLRLEQLFYLSFITFWCNMLSRCCSPTLTLTE